MTRSPVLIAISCFIRCNARKVWTMPSGGNFVTPIFGTPRIVQGRVRYLEENLAVIQAGCPVIVTLPADGTAFDLLNGPLAATGLVNATLIPGTTIEVVKSAATAVAGT